MTSQLPQALRAEAEVEAKEYVLKTPQGCYECGDPDAENAFLSGYASCYSRLTKAEGFETYNIQVKDGRLLRDVSPRMDARSLEVINVEALAQLRAEQALENEAWKEGYDRDQRRISELTSALEIVVKNADVNIIESKYDEGCAALEQARQALKGVSHE